MATNVNNENLPLILHGEKFYKIISINDGQVVVECLLCKAKKVEKKIRANFKATTNFLTHINVNDP